MCFLGGQRGITLTRGAGVTRGFRTSPHNQSKVDVPNSELELLVWFRSSWKDPRLAWDPKKYGGISQTTFRARMNDAHDYGDIWMPDIDIYNTPTSVHSLPNKPVMLRLVTQKRIRTHRPR